MLAPTTATTSVFLALLLLFSLAGYACGLPTIISPTNDTVAEPSWVRDPDGRGTVGLLLSCVLTLGLCVWTGEFGDRCGSGGVKTEKIND